MSNEFPPEIGKYKILGIVAKGGMGVVYKALHPSLKRYIVIKKFTVKGRTAKTNAERFKREAQILLDLQSPYIVHLYDYFTEGTYRYMVEELVDGLACDKLIKKQVVLPVPLAMLIMQDSCYGLKYAHSKKVIHRDIKPGNILISKRGEIKITDFGIASDESEREDNLTAEGMALGTPAYMPPEQFEDSSSVDNRADVYALGITLYEMLTGTKPYAGEFTQENIAKIKKGKFIHPRKINKDIPLEVDRLVCRMIRAKAKYRIKNIDVVLKAVKKYLSHYDVHELRIQLARAVALPDKPYKFSDKAFEPKDKVSRLLKRVLFVCAAIAIVFTGLLHTGVFHRTVLSSIYTPVSVEVSMPVSVFKNGRLDLPVIASFFENDGNDMPEVHGSEREFFVKGSRLWERLNKNKAEKIEESKNGHTIYTMKTVFLKKGDYRVKLVTGPYVRWQSFTVSDTPELIKVDFLQNMKRPLKVHCDAKDAETQEDITASSKFQIFFGGAWCDFDAVPETLLKSGTVWKIKVMHEGYKDEVFSLLIDWYQDELFVTAALRK